jgi:Mn2+/Fe2+ NRAMP family transporter
MLLRRVTPKFEDSMKALIASVFALGLLGASLTSAEAMTIHVAVGHHHWHHHRHCGAWGWHHHARWCRRWYW